MIRELVTTAAITGAAIGGAPVAGADPQRYDGDVPGMNYDASLGGPMLQLGALHFWTRPLRSGRSLSFSAS